MKEGDEIHPQRPMTQSVEDVLLVSQRRKGLPGESTLRPLFTKYGKRPTKRHTLADDFSLPYDISYRRNSIPSMGDNFVLDDSLPATFVNVADSIDKSKNGSGNRSQEWGQMFSELSTFESQQDNVLSFESLEKAIHVHHDIMDHFRSTTLRENPTRGALFVDLCDYYDRLSDEIPKIRDYYNAQYEEAKMKCEISEEEKNVHLKMQQEIGYSIDRQNRSISAIRQQIEDLKNKNSSLESQLRDITNSKTTITRSSLSNQQKLQNYVSQIKEKEKQYEEINNLITTLNEDLKEKTETLSISSHELASIEDTLSKLVLNREQIVKEIHEKKELASILRNKPDIAKSIQHRHIGLMANLLQNKNKKTKKSVEITKETPTLAPSEFNQNKKDMASVQKVMGENLVIHNIDDIKSIREVVLKNNNIFDWSQVSIQKARKGLFNIYKTSNDEARLFAEWTVQGILERSVKARFFESTCMQTDPEAVITLDKDQNEEEDEGSSHEQKKPKMIKSSRFLSSLKTDYSGRSPKPLDWMIHTIRSIFDQKTIDDRTDIVPFHEYIIKWATRYYGEDELAQKSCWDIYLTSHFHMQKCLEVMIFVRFLDEQWTLDQLVFFLACRKWILQRCISIPIQNNDIGEYIQETKLTKAQVHDFFHHHFHKTQPELVQDLTVRGWDCFDSLADLNKEGACIPMYRILELAVGEQHDERIRRMRRMFSFFRIIPRMSGKRFSTLIKRMLPNIDNGMIDSIYRTSVIPNTARTDVEAEEFIQKFNNPDFSIDCSDFSQFSDQYAMVLNRWKQFSPFLDRMLGVLSKQTSNEIRTIVHEIRHCVFQLLESKISFDWSLFLQNYHKLLEVVFNSCIKFNKPDAFSFLKQVGYIEQQLTQKYQHHLDSITE